MSHYIPALPDRPYYHWPPYYATDYHVFPSSPDYPESSQRTILSSSPVLHPIYDHRRSHSSDYNHWQTVQYPDLEMHAEDTGEAMLDTNPDCSQSSPPVKVEPDDPDGCFIMELTSMSPSIPLSLTGINQTLAPPTEVPLRATQASKEMRKMMGVFRLNPFAMHSGEGRGVLPALWCGGGPLEEEPLIFEFQLELEDDSGDRQFDLVVTSGPSGSPTTDLVVGTEDEIQLRSFSPSFELHPEDLKSEMGGDEFEHHHHEQEEQEAAYTDPDQQNEWSDADCGNQSEVDNSSSTSQNSVHTPNSETRSAHTTPFNESSSSSYQYPIINPAVASSWDIVDSYQAQAEERHHLPPVEKMEGGHNNNKMHNRVHITTSHPYLRRNYQASPSSSTHSLSPQSYPHLHTTTTTTTTTTQPQMNFAYPILHQHSTTHHHYNNNNNQVPSQTYSQPTVHDSTMIVSAAAAAAAPHLELMIPHRPENSMYSSSYMRSGRTLKLAATTAAEEDEDDETSRSSSALHHPSRHHHHHPAGIVNEYNPSRRWSLPEAIGGPFRSSGSTM